MAKVISRSELSIKLSWLSMNMRGLSSVIIIKKGNSRRNDEELIIIIGLTNAAVPRTRPILAILLPKALPTARSLEPLKDALTETSSSGADVPNPKIVSPISIGDRPKLRAVALAPVTKRSAPHTNRRVPATMAIICISIGSNLGCFA